MGQKKHGNIHHIRPTSRGGQDTPDNKIKIEIVLHDAWHTLFHNDLMEEAVMKLKTTWRLKDGRLKKSILSRNMLNAYNLLFGDGSCDEAVEIIRRMFVDRDLDYLFRSRV